MKEEIHYEDDLSNLYAPHCLKCGSKNINIDLPKYFLMPSTFLAQNMYYVCDEHKHINYEWNDVYNEDGTRKKNEY